MVRDRQKETNREVEREEQIELEIKTVREKNS